MQQMRLLSCLLFVVPLAAVPLPNSTLITAYETWGGCHQEQIVRAVREGVNVMMCAAASLIFKPVARGCT
jgi:hypothetical protein|eukprot:3314365-Prymnesium_polylepis.1